MKLTSLNELEEKEETLKGEWALGPNHELLYREREKKKEVRLKGQLVAAEPRELIFSATQKEEKGRLVTNLFKLTGSWRLDPQNRIFFEVEKESGKKDKLVFSGTWELGPHYEIIYSYETTRLKRRRKVTETLLFKGTWDLTETNRLAFQIGGDTDQTLRFRGAFQTKSILAKEGEIRYQIGVEVEGKRRKKTLTFFGKWKISKDLELSFEMEYERGEKRTLHFGGVYHFNEKTSLKVELKTRDRKPLGAEVIFTRDFFGKDGQFFLRLRKTFEETAAEAGVTVPW